MQLFASTAVLQEQWLWHSLHYDLFGSAEWAAGWFRQGLIDVLGGKKKTLEAKPEIPFFLGGVAVHGEEKKRPHSQQGLIESLGFVRGG